MRSRLDDEKGAARAEREARVFLARPYRFELVLEVVIAELVENQQVLALAVMRTSDQRDVALAGRYACERDPRRIHTRDFLAHESARGSRHAVHDGDVAGQEVRQLRQEQRRTQIAHQAVIEKAGRGIARRGGVENAGIDREIALTAAGGHNHVHPSEDFLVALDPGGIQRKPGGIGPDPLPGFHLTLIAFFWNLGIEVYRRPGMNNIGRQSFFIDVDAPLVERVPVRVQPFAERGGQTNAGDPDFGRSGIRGFRLSHGSWPVAESRYAGPRNPCVRANPDWGRGCG